MKREGFSLKTEGLLTSSDQIPFLQVIGAKMGHKVNSASRKTMDEFVSRQKKQRILESIVIDHVTYTLKYPNMGWITLTKIEEHFKRVWVQAEMDRDGTFAKITRADNVAGFTVYGNQLKRVDVLNQSFELKGIWHEFVKQDGRWIYRDGSAIKDQNISQSKQMNLQGPIDDAFMSDFVVVGPEGSQNGREQRLLNDFVANWSKFFRGDLPIAIGSDVKFRPEDEKDGNHLVLFGTPKNNRLMAEVMPKLKQIKWSETEFTLGGKTYSTSDHIPVLIAPNPLNTRKYVVINSGHTFGKTDFEGTNALLYPRMGDWGVLKVKSDGSTEIVDSGFFDEQWNPK